MKGEADRETVEEAVHREAAGAEHAALPARPLRRVLVAARRDGAVEDHVNDEAQRDDRQHGRRRVGRHGEAER